LLFRQEGPRSCGEYIKPIHDKEMAVWFRSQ
jgi:hypothetical protein